ncbi:MAG: hypothetical protein Kow00117_07570 [Phototrophicales bacterium]
MKTKIFSVLLFFVGILAFVMLNLSTNSIEAQRPRPTTDRSTPQFQTPVPPTIPIRNTPQFQTPAPPTIPTRNTTQLTEAAATAQGIATQFYQGVENYELTLTAIWTAFPTLEASDIEQQLTDLMRFMEQISGSITYNDDTLTLTMLLYEEDIEAVVDAALVAAGYAPSDVTVDLIPNGITITVVVDNQVIAMTYLLVETETGYTLQLTTVTLNGRNMPSAAYEDLVETINSTVESLFIPIDSQYITAIDITIQPEWIMISLEVQF